MAEALSFVASVGGFVIAVLIGCAWLVVRPRSAAVRRAFLTVAAAYTLSSMYVVPYLAGRVLSLGYKPLQSAEIPARHAAIVVLGSGSFTVKNWSDEKFSLVDPVAASRVLEAARVYRFAEAPWIISSGGLARRTGERTASGTTMRDALVRLGVPPDRIIVETDSRNTHEEALIIAAILARLRVEHVVLVTTAAHMRRSVGTFRAAGVEVLPAVARDPFAADPLIGWILPSELGLRASNSVAHEVVGLLYYLVRGWYR